MKLNYKNTDSFLKSPATSAVAALIYGPDGGMVRTRAKEIRTALLGKEPDSFAFLELNEDVLKENPTRLNEELSAISLMGGNRVVQLDAPTDKYAAIIEQALPFANAENFLIITAAQMPPRNKLRQCFEQLKNTAALPCYLEEGQNLARVIRTGLDAKGLRATRDVVDYLTSELGNDHGVTLSELEKIALYKDGENSLSLEEAQRLVGGNSEVTVDDLCHALAGGNMVAFIKYWRFLVSEGNYPVMLLRALQRHYLRLHTLKMQIGQEGMSVDAAIDSAKPPIFFKLKGQFRTQLMRYKIQDLSRSLAILQQAELDCKTTQLAQGFVGEASLLQAAAGRMKK